MKIYDISQELLECVVFPGDPEPEKITLMKKSEGAVCNLSALKMCAHNGTHVDAPYHFIDEGKTIDEVDINKFVGYAYVAEHSGDITKDDAMDILKKADIVAETYAKNNGLDICDNAGNRILIKGNAVLTEEAAKVLADRHIFLFGNESQTVGPEDAPQNVHMIMLGAEIVLLEGIRLRDVDEGVYILNAAPVNVKGADGSPCRAILMSL
ncbi:MAG: cyclase family protein [Lachnospiraceae bacterium]|nr:cyclase family protein [Lachnospiraceae bacterium]